MLLLLRADTVWWMVDGGPFRAFSERWELHLRALLSTPLSFVDLGVKQGANEQR